MKKYFTFLRRVIYFPILLLGILFATASNASEIIDDVRIVIDVSGSMQQTDPSNARISALKLLGAVIPDGSKAGVWTLGRYVNMAVKWGVVDDQWRLGAAASADLLHSNGRFRNLDKALKHSTVGWKMPFKGVRRSIILLTDGQVAISKYPAKNERSRQNIRQQRIQALKKLGVRVYAIALSQAADEVLLKQLALDTGGSFVMADYPRQLPKLFFEMFAKATLPDFISLDNNQFTIDSSVKKMTLLLFRSDVTQPAKLISPEGQELSAKTPTNATWQSDAEYDLISLKAPSEGVWKIDASLDSESRLMVVTDLKLNIPEIPAYVFPDQPVTIRAELHNKGSMIRKNNYLRFVKFALQHSRSGDEKKFLSLQSNRDRENKGQYIFPINRWLTEGNHRFVISAKGQTFDRSKRVEVKVEWPASIELKQSRKPGDFKLLLKVREEYLKLDSFKPFALLEAPDASRQELTISRLHNEWRADIVTNQDGVYRVMIRAQAETVAGELKDIDLGAYPITGIYKSAEIIN